MPQRFVSSTRSYSSRSVSVDRLQQADAGVVAEDVDTAVARRPPRARVARRRARRARRRRRTRARGPRSTSDARELLALVDALAAIRPRRAPSDASRTAIARPMPRPAPVTIATFPSSRLACRRRSLVISDDMLASRSIWQVDSSSGGAMASTTIDRLARGLPGDLHAVHRGRRGGRRGAAAGRPLRARGRLPRDRRLRARGRGAEALARRAAGC